MKTNIYISTSSIIRTSSTGCEWYALFNESKGSPNGSLFYFKIIDKKFFYYENNGYIRYGIWKIKKLIVYFEERDNKKISAYYKEKLRSLKQNNNEEESSL